MAKMHRTQIYLEPELNERLERLARKRRVSKGSLLRLAARRMLEDELGSEGEDPILGIIGLGHGGPPGNVAQEHDKYLADYELARWRR